MPENKTCSGCNAICGDSLQFNGLFYCCTSEMKQAQEKHITRQAEEKARLALEESKKSSVL